MSKRDPNAVVDGISLILRGVNSGLPPISLGRDQLAWGVNCTTRGQYPTNRPGFVRRVLQFLDEDGIDPDLAEAFQGGIFQGAIAFERQAEIVTMISGRLYRITPDNWNVLDISVPNDPNPTNRYRAWFCEAEDYIIAQDGQSAAMLYNGATTIRSDPFGIHGPKQVPAGTAMVYSQGRVLVSLTNNRQFVIGDIVGGDSGTAINGFRDAVIYFTENDVINGGGAFSIPINAGAITAFRPVAQVDTSTGQGPTQIFTTGGIFSLNTPNDRTQWADVNFPIGTVSMVSGGATSDRATVNVNGDIWTRSLDGVRSFIVARRDFTSWVNAPMSQEVVRAIGGDDKDLLGYSSATLFDNRLIMTANPYRVWDHGIAHRSLIVIDFAPLAFLNTRVAPVWEGMWTGLQVFQVITGTFNGVERCFAFVLNASNQIELWEFTKDALHDYNGSENIPIQWSIETCGLNFPRSSNSNPTIPGGDLQSLDNGQLFVDSMAGDVSFSLQYRPDQDPCWHDWHSWNLCANTELCVSGDSPSVCVTPLNYQQQYRRPFRLPKPLEACDSVTNKPLNIGAEFQAKITVTGHCRLKRWELIAHDVQEEVTGLCAPNESCKTVECCDNSDLSYVIPT